MDYSELIENLKNLETIAYGYNINGEVFGMDCSDFEQIMVDAADAIAELNQYKELGSLDRLRELATADKEGRGVVLPCKGWLEIVFGEQEVFYGIDHDYAENPVREISVDSSDRCTWYNGWKTVVLKGYDENGLDWEFSPEDIGKTVFLSREDAEKALE